MSDFEEQISGATSDTNCAINTTLPMKTNCLNCSILSSVTRWLDYSYII